MWPARPSLLIAPRFGLLVALAAAGVVEGSAAHASCAAAAAVAAAEVADDGQPADEAVTRWSWPSSLRTPWVEVLSVQLLQTSLALDQQASGFPGDLHVLAKAREEQLFGANASLRSVLLQLDHEASQASGTFPVLLMAGFAVFVCLIATTVGMMQGFNEAAQEDLQRHASSKSALTSQREVPSPSRGSPSNRLPRVSNALQPQAALPLERASVISQSQPVLPADRSSPRHVRPSVSPAAASAIAVPTPVSPTSASGSQMVNVDVPQHLLGAGAQLGFDLSEASLTVTGFADSQAMVLGFSIGDRIVQVNGHVVSNQSDFMRELSFARGRGEPLRFGVLRQGAPQGFHFPAFASLSSEAARVSVVSSPSPAREVARVSVVSSPSPAREVAGTVNRFYM